MSGSFFYRPKSQNRTKEISKKRWNVGAFILKVLKRTCMTLGALILISAILGTITTVGLMKKASPPLPDKMALVLKIENGIAEIPSSPTFSDPFPFMQPTIRQVIDTIDRAAIDPRVKTFILNYRGGSISLTHIQELRPAIKRFRASGKKALIYSSSYASGMGTGLGIYYLAAAFDEIWMQPIGMVSIAGISMEMPFGRKVLDKLGVKPSFYQREEYKTAMENFARNEMSDESRETMVAIVKSMSSQMLKEIAEDRKIDAKVLKVLIDKGMLTDDEALDAGLVDHLNYGDVLVSQTRENIMGDKDDEALKFTKFSYYAGKTDTKPSETAQTMEQKNVALIYITGTIKDDPKGQGAGNAVKIATAIQEAYEDDSIEAIILRVDSPGGSPSASETIRRSIVRAKEEGKFVVVSMGSLAASGGYWVAAPADKIYALPSTITGSIGVIMGKFVLNDFWKKIGVNWNGVHWGDNANMLSFNSDFSASQETRMNTLIDSTYNAFIDRVAEGRGMKKEDVRKIAKGRAWTGADGIKVGLIDELGGLDAALNDLAEEYGLANKDDLNVVVMPKPQTPVEQFIEMFANQASLGLFLKENAGVLEGVNDVMERANVMMNAPDYSVYEADFDALR